MQLLFSDGVREGFVQSSEDGAVTIYIDGLGIVTLKIEQLVEIEDIEEDAALKTG